LSITDRKDAIELQSQRSPRTRRHLAAFDFRQLDYDFRTASDRDFVASWFCLWSRRPRIYRATTTRRRPGEILSGTSGIAPAKRALNSRGQHPKAVEADALRTRLSHGMRLIDTAEMYGDGDSENLINAVIAGQRDQAFLVSKVLPHHASGDGIARACGAVSPASAPIISISICCTGGMPRLTCQG